MRDDTRFVHYFVIPALIVPALIVLIACIAMSIYELTSCEKEDVWVDTMDTVNEIDQHLDKHFVLQKCMKVQLFGGEIISYFHSTYKEYGQALEVRDHLRKTFGAGVIIKDFYFNADVVEVIDWERVCTEYSLEEGYSIWILP